MIKILKEGNLVEKTCEKCGCLFQFDKKTDVKTKPDNHYSRFACGYKREYIECPQCNEEIVLSSTR